MMRSVLNLMRQAAKGFTLDASPSAVDMFTFNSPKVAEKWHVFSDAYFGGRSRAAFVYNPEEQAAEFSGRVTLDQDEDADIKRAGYCVASSKVTHIADYWDLSGCTHLVLRVKGDGRTYIANVRTDSIAGTGGDVWQAPFRTRADEWQSVHIPLQSLVLTYQGQLVRRQLEFQANQVISVGLAASALPAAEAEAAGAVDLPVDFADLSSSSEAASTSSAGNVQHSATSSVSGTANGAHSGADSLSAADEDELQNSESSYPEHERFKLLIRSIQADVQF